MNDFNSLGLPASLMQSLAKMQFTTPTPIQAMAIPPALQGRDILGSAQTGTGKTGAFGIPLVAKLMNNPRGSALVLTPTRELAVQVMDIIKKLIGTAPIKTALLIGGEPMPPQLNQLRARPRVIVGTPGRINDHLGRGSLMLHEASFLVLDETDRMLDMGFGIQLDAIARFLPKERQTLMFSATLPNNIVKVSEKYLKNPERVSAGAHSVAAPKIKQEVIHTTETEKYGALLNEINNREGSIIIFVKTKRGADRMATKLAKANHSAEAIHGDLLQRKRDRVIQGFRDKKHRILVATDIASRGLDIPHIEHVINYDLPHSPDDFIHRIGRTARAGAEGHAATLLLPEDARQWRLIHRLLNPNEPPPPNRLPTGNRSPFEKGRGNGGSKGPGGNSNGNRRRRFRKPGNAGAAQAAA